LTIEGGFRVASQTEQLKARTERFAIGVIRLFQSLPRKEETRIIGRQLLRSATSVGANYRAVCRARSRKEFVSKVGIVVEEADETVFWLELLGKCELADGRRIAPLIREASELLAIFAASQRTVKYGKASPPQSSMIQSSMIQSATRS
jgi:four helix bundle protein